MIRTRERRERERGFTMVELIVVVSILVLLMGLLAPKFFTQAKKAQIKIAQMQLGKIKTALDRASLDTGHYPTTEQGLHSLTQTMADAPNWNGPYLEAKDLKDPWDHEFIYRWPCQHGGIHEYDLFSLGPNGVEEPGGGGDDIRSWE